MEVSFCSGFRIQLNVPLFCPVTLKGGQKEPIKCSSKLSSSVCFQESLTYLLEIIHKPAMAQFLRGPIFFYFFPPDIIMT